MFERSKRSGVKSEAYRAPEPLQHGAMHLRGERWTRQMRYEQKMPQFQEIAACQPFADLAYLALSNPNRLKKNRNKLFESDWLSKSLTHKTILRLASDEARRTYSRYKAWTRVSRFAEGGGMAVFARDAPRAPARPPTNGVRKRDRDRRERVRLAGGTPPSLRERAVALALKKGEVRTKDLTDIGVHRCYLGKMCEEGLLVKVGYGRYRAKASDAKP